MSRGRGKNPVPPSSIKRRDMAVDLFKQFTGMEPQYFDTLDIPTPKTALAIGSLDGVMYTTVRDGKTEKYIHRFKKSARPLLCATFDGQQLIVIGGSYRFTDRGIVDD